MTGSTVEIRPFTTEDFVYLEDIRARAFAPIFQSFREIVGPDIAPTAFAAAEREQADHLAALCDAASPERVFVAVMDGTLVGFAAMSLNVEQRTGEIGLNAVDPDHAGQGIGPKLYEFILMEMREAGMDIATVGTGGDPSHAPARRAYEKAGFGPSLPSLWMYRKL